MYVNNNISFSGVIPVKVILDGKETLNKKIVHKACQNAVKGLSGPLREKPDFKVAAAQLSVMDNDYKYARAFFGYDRLIPDQKLTASKFFKIIFDKHNRGYIVTGKPSENLSDLGRQIGLAQRECNEYNVSTSPKLEQAKKNYWQYVADVGNNLLYRIRETFIPNTLEKAGNYQQMNLNVSAKPVKRKGAEDFKVTIDSITFSDYK